MKPGRPSTAFVILNTAFLWAAMASASIGWWPVYEFERFVIVVLITLVAGSAVAIAGALLRWRSFLVLAATAATFLVIGVPLAVPSEARYVVIPTIEGLVDLVLGVALGWRQLVTISLPVGDYEALLVPFFFALLVATVVGLSVALRAKRPELATLAPVILFALSIAFGSTEPAWPVRISLVLLGVTLLWLIWFRWYRRRAAIRALAAQAGGAEVGETDAGFVGARTLLGAGIVLAIAAAVAISATAIIPPSVDRTVLRSSIEQPFDPRSEVSPLVGFRSYWQPQRTDQVLFSVSGIEPGSFIRLAALDTYDGVVYSVGNDRVSSESGSFTRVPQGIEQSAEGGRVSASFTIESLDGVWLPVAGLVERVDFTSDGSLRDAFTFNRTSDTGAIIGGLEPGIEYSITSVVPLIPDTAELADLTPGSATVPTPAVIPVELSSALDRYIDDEDTPGAQLVAAIESLTADGYVSHGGQGEPSSRSGHSAERVNELFAAPRMIGDGEQYATAAAIMANELGFPSRVVVGFVASESDVRARDIVAMIEVDTAEFGWVMIDPNPPVRPIPDELPEDPSAIARPQTIVPPTVIEGETFDRQPTPDRQDEPQPTIDPFLQLLLAIVRGIGIALLVVAIIGSPFLVIIAAKLRRRALRRRSRVVVERIVNGWAEFEDAVVDRGVELPVSATRSEVAAAVRFAQSDVLAAVADRAVFAPGEPTADDADAVWRAVDDLIGYLDHDLSRWQRIKARISLRSLGGYSVSKLFKR